MTDQTPGSAPPETDPSRRELKADAAAAKARSKASRPIYRKKRFIIPAVIVVIGAVASLSGDDANEPANGSEATAATDEAEAVEATEVDDTTTAGDEPEVTGIGSPARDGSFEFTVNGLDCGVESVGDEFMEETPQGTYCLLDVRVENIGDSSGALFADNQYLLNDEGTQYSADSMATIVHSDSGDAFFSEINPGNAVEGVIVFDTPEDAGITSARLHDSAFSGGVEVNVTG